MFYITALFSHDLCKGLHIINIMMFCKGCRMFFTDIRVYRAAKRRGDKETVKVLRQGNISSALMILNVAAILAITFVLHPESIG